jgi:peptidoglycan/LPS O-acetylase OafA/YrhL
MPTTEKYGLPRRPPVWLRAAIVVVGGAILLTLLWLLMPDSPVGVALDAILTLVIVFGGVFWALSGRDTDTSEPGRVDAGGGRERESNRWTGPPSAQSS